ncbi:MAG: hypothetical protein ACE5Q3_17435, partial [Alphaproteobacteria bacterium]
MAKLYNHVKGLIASLSALMIMAGGGSASRLDAADDDLDKALDQIQLAARDPLADAIQLAQTTPRGIDWAALIAAQLGKPIAEATPVELELAIVDAMFQAGVSGANFEELARGIARSVIAEVGAANTAAVEAVKNGILAAAPLGQVMAGGGSASRLDAADDDLDKALDQIQLAARDP